MPMQDIGDDAGTVSMRSPERWARLPEVNDLRMPPPPPARNKTSLKWKNLLWALLATVGFLCSIAVPPLGVLLSCVVRIRFSGAVSRERDLAEAGLLIGIVETVLLSVGIAAAWALVGGVDETLRSIMSE